MSPFSIPHCLRRCRRLNIRLFFLLDLRDVSFQTCLQLIYCANHRVFGIIQLFSKCSPFGDDGSYCGFVELQSPRHGFRVAYSKSLLEPNRKAVAGPEISTLGVSKCP